MDAGVHSSIRKFTRVSPPVLSYPDLTVGRFIIDCDASTKGVGATLSQVQQGEERLLGYFSHALSPAEANYCTTRLELLSILKALRQFHVFVAHAPKTLIRTVVAWSTFTISKLLLTLNSAAGWRRSNSTTTKFSTDQVPSMPRPTS